VEFQLRYYTCRNDDIPETAIADVKAVPEASKQRFYIALCIALAIALVAVSLSPKTPFNERPDINVEHKPGEISQSDHYRGYDETSRSAGGNCAHAAPVPPSRRKKYPRCRARQLRDRASARRDNRMLTLATCVIGSAGTAAYMQKLSTRAVRSWPRCIRRVPDRTRGQ
jgi:hypothetical protein